MKIKRNTFSQPGSTIQFTLLEAISAILMVSGLLSAEGLYNLSGNREKLQIRYANLRV